MVNTNHLWWLGGWFIIAIPTLYPFCSTLYHLLTMEQSTSSGKKCTDAPPCRFCCYNPQQNQVEQALSREQMVILLHFDFTWFTCSRFPVKKWKPFCENHCVRLDQPCILVGDHIELATPGTSDSHRYEEIILMGFLNQDLRITKG